MGLYMQNGPAKAKVLDIQQNVMNTKSCIQNYVHCTFGTGMFWFLKPCAHFLLVLPAYADVWPFLLLQQSRWNALFRCSASLERHDLNDWLVSTPPISAGEIHILDVFRRPQDLPGHLDDILAAKPKVVWLQSGISNPEFEQQLADAGIMVVADRCLKVDHQAAASSARL